MAGQTDILTNRDKIDKIDEQILSFLNERAEISLSIREIKRAAGEALYSPKREEEVLQTLCQKNDGPLYNDNVREIFSNVMRIMRGLPDD